MINIDHKFTVLLLSTNSDLAGAPIHVLSIIRALSPHINFISVFGQDGPIADTIRNLNIPVEIIPDMRSNLNIKSDFLSLLFLSRLIIKYKPNLIHAHSSKAGMLGRIIAFRYKLPCLYTVHGWGWRGKHWIIGSIIFTIEKLLSFIPNISLIYVSRSVEIEALNKLYLPQRLGTVIHNGVSDFYRFLELHDPIRILMPARVAAAKDHETLIKAFECFLVPSRLILCGEGTDSDSFKKDAFLWAPTRFADIDFLGSRSDMLTLLNSIDIFALISNFEALPLSIVEAMSAMKAIIATDVGGVSELIDHGVNGILVKKNDVNSVLSALDIFADKKVRDAFSKHARMKYLSNFTLQKMISKIFLCYCILINRCNTWR